MEIHGTKMLHLLLHEALFLLVVISLKSAKLGRNPSTRGCIQRMISKEKNKKTRNNIQILHIDKF